MDTNENVTVFVKYAPYRNVHSRGLIDFFKNKDIPEIGISIVGLRFPEPVYDFKLSYETFFMTVISISGRREFATNSSRRDEINSGKRKYTFLLQ